MKFFGFYIFTAKQLADYLAANCKCPDQVPCPEVECPDAEAEFRRGVIEGANEESTVFEDVYQNGFDDGFSAGRG